MKQPTKEIISYGVQVWKSIDHTETGGFTLDTTGLPDGATIRAGAMMSFDTATRMAKVIPSAILIESTDADDVALKIGKGSIFTVGKNVANVELGKAYPITAIDTTGSNDFDTITISTTLGALPAGTALFLSTTTGSNNAATGATVNGLLVEDTKIEKGVTVDVGIHGVIYARRTPGVPAGIRTKLPQISFSESY